MKKPLLILIILLFSPVAFAGEHGTVIKVKGSADIQRQGEQEWFQIKRGQKVQLGDKIQTVGKAVLRILNIDGSIIRIKGQKAFTYAGAKNITLAKGSWGSALQELQTKRSRKIVAATRGAVVTREIEELRAHQEIWMDIMEQHLTTADEEDVFILSSWYEQQHKDNRKTALLWKLGYDLPDKALEKQAIQERSNHFNWSVSKFIDGQESNAEPEDNLNQGDQVQIIFRPKQESYYYLFYSSQPFGKSIETTLLSPSSFSATKVEDKIKYYEAKVKAGEQYKTPKYPLDDVVGVEHFWGWSCSGPILDILIEQQARNAVIDDLSTSRRLVPNKLTQATPKICNLFTLSLKGNVMPK